MSNGFSLEPLPNFGAAITRLDPGGPILPDEARALYQAWLEYGVLVFPGAGVSREGHIALSEVFGELEEHPNPLLRDKDYPKLAPFGSPETKGGPIMVDGELRAGYIFWHQDTAFTPNLCKGSMLRIVVAPGRGGDTVWCDTARAYADLPRSTQDRLERLETLQAMRQIPPRRPWGMPDHSAAHAPDETGKLVVAEFGHLPDVRHPMVVTHPESGRKALLLSPLGFMRILGMEEQEGADLFDELVAHTIQDKYCYRHHWRPDDMVLWDNRRTMHMALGYPYEMTRLGLRTTLKGAMPTGRLHRQ